MASADDYRRVDLGGKPAEQPQYSQTNAPEPTGADLVGGYPDSYRAEQIPGTQEPATAWETTERPGDPLELQRQADQSASGFADLQKYLNNSLDCMGSRLPADSRIHNPEEEAPAEKEGR